MDSESQKNIFEEIGKLPTTSLKKKLLKLEILNVF